MDTDMENLFEMPVCESPRLKWLNRVKSDLKIFTTTDVDGKWLAFSMTKAIELLDGYNLTDKQKSDPWALFGGYCRLLEESKQLADFEKTEADAIIKVAMIHGLKMWNEEQLTPTV